MENIPRIIKRLTSLQAILYVYKVFNNITFVSAFQNFWYEMGENVTSELHVLGSVSLHGTSTELTHFIKTQTET